MHIEDFIRSLEELGFIKDIGFQDTDPVISLWKAPERLAEAVSWLSIGGTSGASKPKGYGIGLQGPDLEELGSVFGPLWLSADQELIAALQLDGRGFSAWLSNRPLASIALTNETTGKSKEGFVTHGGKIHTASDDVQ